ncbi:MAG: kinase/pyrophosphorylase [Syntrophales bacterium]|nr:kinase/pyrophosphorylase [Syntrophales bacterium]MDY0045036.1 pyruvate, water dikinase regulatory protein [Syntrophales bacterium]
MTKTVFFISDGTGITAETLGHTLLTQFPTFTFEAVRLPFTNTRDKVKQAVERINRIACSEDSAPLVFSTLTDPLLRDHLSICRGEVIDFFAAFTNPIEQILGLKSAPVAGRSHGIGNLNAYSSRIDAVQFSLQHDDGSASRDYSQADIILTGVSRTGKTPTCLYLALHFGIQAANYPLTDENFGTKILPDPLQAECSKLFGLTIAPERLYQIRQERRPNSAYATMEQIRRELRAAESLFRRAGIPYLNITNFSIEEIAASVMQQASLMSKNLI